jgi:hypothetical protein
LGTQETAPPLQREKGYFTETVRSWRGEKWSKEAVEKMKEGEEISC